ncbi:hypothetical protein GCM10009739_11280 [Microbacterium ulmi]
MAFGRTVSVESPALPRMAAPFSGAAAVPRSERESTRDEPFRGVHASRGIRGSTA